MAKRLINTIKLGSFVLAGLILLVLLLYMIGKNKNLFGSTYVLKARFENVQGLVAGNNVRFSGIQTGTVKKISIINDTVIEVTMVIDTRMKTIIRKNAVTSISTDGIVGNKVVNIFPSKQPGELAMEGDILLSRSVVSADDVMQSVSNALNNVAAIANDLKTTIQKLNASSGLWALLNDHSLPDDVRLAVANVRSATRKAGTIADNLNSIVSDVKNGKGSMGAFLKDTSFVSNLNDAVLKIKSIGAEADSLAGDISQLVAGISQDINYGKGTVYTLLKDTTVVIKINESLSNVQKGTEAFNQNMEALKHHFLFRGYYKKLEKQEEKEAREKAEGER